MPLSRKGGGGVMHERGTSDEIDVSPRARTEPDRGTPVRIVICWPHLSGYMAACWRALAQRPGVDLHVLAWSTPGGDAPFDNSLVDGAPVRLLDDRERNDAALIREEVSRHRPEVIAIAGWFHPPYVDLALRRHGGAKFLMGMDTPWRGTLRQRLAPYKLRKLIKSIDGIVVAGERAYQYARVLGTPEGRIFRGYYGFDYGAFAPLYERRLATAGGWPKRFGYTGRYAPEKCVPELVSAYRAYRRSVPDPWPLTCCGHGPLKSTLADVEGVEDLGFVQPRDLPDALLRHGASVLPSRYEPWGVVVAEALASGLPVLCTEAVGASVELVRSYHNGLTVAPENVGALARGMRWLHENHARLPEMGLRGRELASAFSARRWAERWQEAAEHVLRA